ncbi:MAG: hypothetical protein HZB82_03235 [Deltaproteobacteria bacterium]|nr:hypothetical protein [Deltaproteobacteria bacterium]
MEFINEAAGLIGEYRTEQEGMLRELRDGLAGRIGLRKKDFNNLIEDMLGYGKEAEKRVRESLGALWKEEGEIIKLLKDILTTGKTADIETLKNARLPQLQKKEGDAAKLLMGLQVEQAELSIALKQLLSRGEKTGIKELKAFVRTMDIRRKERIGGLDGLFDELSRVRLDVITKWNGVFSTDEILDMGVKGTRQQMEF